MKHFVERNFDGDHTMGMEMVHILLWERDMNFIKE